MEQHTDPHFEESHSGEVRSWFQENLRIIVSIFIVAAIALGIYSYSQRNANLSDEDIASLLETKGSDANSDQSSDAMKDNGMKADETVSKGTVVTPELSQENDSSYTETAEPGDGMTHLARRALTHTLEDNSDISLTSEQKIYVEDYLRKHVGGQQALHPGSKVDFSKEAINQAIASAKTLNEAQLANLKQYSQRVSSYR